MATLYSSQAIADSSENTSGKIRVSTNSEALAGTNDTTAMTPAKVAAYVASATGTVTGSLTYKGAYDASANSPVLTSAKKGDFYVVSVAGTLAGVALNVGDHIVFNQDAASPITSAMFDTIDNTETPASTTTAGVIEIATDAEATAGSAGDKALVPSNVASLSIANTQVTGLGTASTASTGTSAGNVVVLDGSARLPAVDGSQLTNLPSASAASTTSAGVIEIATNTEAGAGSASDKALVPSNVASLSIANTQVTGLGTASTASTGTSAGNVVVLDGSARLPAVDASQLTNLPSASAATESSAGIIEIATNTEAGAGSATDKALVPSNVGSLVLSPSQVTGLATVATSGAYSDISGTPTLGTASSADTGTSAGNVVVLDGSARLPAVDASQLTNLPSATQPSLTVLSNTTYTLTSANAKGIHIWYGADNTTTFTLTMPDVSDVISTATATNGDPQETFEVYVGRGRGGDITISAADGIDALGDGSITYSTTQTVSSGQWIKIIGWYINGSTQRYVMSSAAQPYDAGLQSISELTTVADKMIYTTASDTYATADLTSAGRALLDDADAAAQRTTLGLGTASTAASTDFLSGTGTDTLGGDLDVGTSDIISSSNNAIELAPHGTGVVTIKGNATGGSGQIKLNCENNSHGIIIKGPPHSASATYTLTLPNDDGSADQVLKTDGSGALSWVDQASGGGGGGGWTYSAVTANTTAQASYHYSCGAGNQSFTLSLPAVSGVSAGQEIRVKNMGTGTITIASNGSEQIDGSTSDYTLDIQYSAVTLVSTGSAWEII